MDLQEAVRVDDPLPQLHFRLRHAFRSIWARCYTWNTVMRRSSLYRNWVLEAFCHACSAELSQVVPSNPAKEAQRKKEGNSSRLRGDSRRLGLQNVSSIRLGMS